jgi:hypothetical protein
MTTASTTRTGSGRERQTAAPERARLFPIVALACAIALAVGFALRDEAYLTPEFGLGYGLGVIGLGAMVALLSYVVRKRVRALGSWGPLRHWFNVHMLLGVLGPVAILFHANFEVHSTNAAVALGTMLIVAGSGFIGRFAYVRVHRGLFGQRETLREVSARAEASRSALHGALRALPGVEAGVRAFEVRALEPASGALDGLWRALALGQRTRAAQRQALRALREAPSSALPVGPEPVARALRAHLSLVRRVAEFGFYERVLALWHALHVPLCVVLFIAAAIHVVAVHLY